jgi:hypothetical protein
MGSEDDKARAAVRIACRNLFSFLFFPSLLRCQPGSEKSMPTHLRQTTGHTNHILVKFASSHQSRVSI